MGILYSIVCAAALREEIRFTNGHISFIMTELLMLEKAVPSHAGKDQWLCFFLTKNIIQICSGITRGSVLTGPYGSQTLCVCVCVCMCVGGGGGKGQIGQILGPFVITSGLFCDRGWICPFFLFFLRGVGWGGGIR